MAHTEIRTSRKIKVHRKSRRGCGNCKLRKVKCDESKPKCKRCIEYGVFCDYDGKYSSLQLSADGAFKIQVMQNVPHPTKHSIQYNVAPTMRVRSDEGVESITSYQLKDQDMEILRKFQMRTVFTISNVNNVDSYRTDMIRLACSRPYLIHSIITLTLMHDRFLSSVSTPLSAMEAFHWSQSVSLLKDKLSWPVEPLDLDGLWAAAMCLGIISFFYVEAKTPEDAWPLKSSSSTDLGWLTMCDGKKLVLATSDPPSKRSQFIALPDEIRARFLSAKIWLDALPSEFMTLYEFDGSSTQDNNPYFEVAMSLAQILHVTSIMPIIFGFLTFISSMSPKYKFLLMHKDHRAMLLLAFWFAKMCQAPHWWITPRAAMEGRAICIYLEQNSDEADIATLLQYPKSMLDKFQQTHYLGTSF